MPVVGGTSPRIARASEVLPQPDSPTSARISPCRTTRSTPSTARAGAWPRPRKVTPRPWTSSAGTSAPTTGPPGAGLGALTRPVRPARTPQPARARRPAAAARRRWSSSAARPGSAGGRCSPGGSRWGSGGSPGRPRGARRDARSPIVGKAAPSASLYGCLGSPNRSLAGPSSTTRPAYITATRSQVAPSTDRSWLIIIMPTPRSRTSEPIRSSTWACTITSSAVVGSSAITSRGRQASAIAIITRCFWPPETWCGYALARRCGSPTCSSRSFTRPSASRWRHLLVQQDRLGDLLADGAHRR